MMQSNMRLASMPDVSTLNYTLSPAASFASIGDFLTDNALTRYRSEPTNVLATCVHLLGFGGNVVVFVAVLEPRKLVPRAVDAIALDKSLRTQSSFEVAPPIVLVAPAGNHYMCMLRFGETRSLRN